MRRFISAVLLVIGLLFAMPDSYALAKDADFIDVRVGKTYAILDRVLLSSRGGFSLVNKGDKESKLMNIDSNRIYVSISFTDSRSLDIFDASNNYITTIPADGSLVLGPEEGSISTAGISYRGYIGFISGTSGLILINHVDVESYLYGVVPKEIPPLSSEEALKAQAVAARSFVYNSLKKHAAEGYNLCDTTHCQAYGGLDGEHPNTNMAVDDTFGLVATYNGLPANTVYHSSSGGHTENSEKVWATAIPYLRAVNDPFSTNGPNSSWSVVLAAHEIEDKLKAEGYDIGRVEGISIKERSESGRVTLMEIIGSRDSVELTGAQFRTLMGAITFKSTLFYIGDEAAYNSGVLYATDSRRKSELEVTRRGFSVIGKNGETTNISAITAMGVSGIKTFGIKNVETVMDDEYLITGKGFGHGVGMSQYGAIEMAKQGYTFEEILKHYYRNIELTIFYR